MAATRRALLSADVEAMGNHARIEETVTVQLPPPLAGSDRRLWSLFGKTSYPKGAAALLT